MKKLPQRDPGAYVRKVIATRRVGGRKCACGESRPGALVPSSEPLVCAACQRKSEGRPIYDEHHPAGKANDPTTTPIPVNDHRADLNVRQYDWPKTTLENPDGSPLLAAAGRNRGYTETNGYLVNAMLRQNTEVLEVLNAYLVKRLGAKWWVGTELEQFAPKHLPTSRRKPDNCRS